MAYKLSKFGEKLSSRTGIQELMDDLGRAMAGQGDMLMLGGGNPAGIPGIQAIWRARMARILDEVDIFDAMLGNYDTPQGRPGFIDALVGYLNRTYDWGLTREHIAVTNGSQNAFFYLFNMLAGEFADGRRRKILMPLAPEYIGYADQGLHPELFASHKPVIEYLDAHTFKYHVEFDHLKIDDSVAALAVSRPTNPTGNVLTDEEIRRLSRLAHQHDIPLIIDNAYGAPFPGILFSDPTPVWDEHIILGLSLSKLGLPGTRTGIVIARPEIARAIASVNAVVSLASGNIGQEFVTPLLESGEITRICREEVRPFYRQRLDQARGWVDQYFDPDLPWYMHKTEGAMFLWLWCKDLPITSRELYERLKQRRVLVVPGSYFFYGLDEPWAHRDECLRINYSQPEPVVREGLKIIAEEVRRAYGEKKESAPGRP